MSKKEVKRQKRQDKKFEKRARKVAGVKEWQFLSGIRFNNGARFVAHYCKNPPRMAKRAKDFVHVGVHPANGRGEPDGWWMNQYDISNLLLLLLDAQMGMQLKGHKPK